MNKYRVTFTQKDKYHPITRTVEVETMNESAARYCVHNEFDSFKWNKKVMQMLPTGKHISIDSVEEVKDEEINNS